MQRYCKVIDKEKGLVQLGTGCNDEYYIEIGMKLRDVDLSEVDGRWYLTEKCPHYTPEEKLDMAKKDKYDEANSEANNFLENYALFELYSNFHIEATKENMNTFATASMGIEKGLIPYQEWTSKEDNKRQLTLEECLSISMGIGLIQNDVWNTQYNNFVLAIKQAQTIEQVEKIQIIYTQETGE